MSRELELVQQDAAEDHNDLLVLIKYCLYKIDSFEEPDNSEPIDYAPLSAKEIFSRLMEKNALRRF